LSRRLPIEKALGVRFGSQELYTWAFTHRSYAYENGGLPTNERLEFLGDAVLGLVVTDIIYRAFPNLPEGQLAKLRAATVNMNVLADVARELGVGAAVQLGRGEELSGGRDKSSILADTLEAILGAVYMDKGLPRAAALVRRLFQERVMEAAGRGAALDYKTSLQELAASSLGGMPSYSIEEEGPDHAKRFTATVSVAGVAYGSGKGRSKKEAEQNAAQEAFETLAASRMVTGTAGDDQADMVEAGPLPARPEVASPAEEGAGPADAGPGAAQANGQRGGRTRRRRARATEPQAGAAASADPGAPEGDEPPSG
jgi:ribonuclease-3